MASLLREMLQERKELKNQEIVLVEEVKKEFGFYVLVLMKPRKVKYCTCPNRQFKGNSHLYHFGYAYLVSDKLKQVGIACQHYLYSPTQNMLDKDFNRFFKCQNESFFKIAEVELEKKFEQAFGAA